MRITADIESRSRLDLKSCGVHRYAEDPSTDVTHFGYQIDQQPVRLWLPMQEEMPADLRDALCSKDVVLVAHVAGFERTMLTGPAGKKIGMPAEIADLDRWSCTAARAAAIGLSRKLKEICRALSLPLQKDAEGHALMLRYCKPQADGTWLDDEASTARMGLYCRADVAAEALLDRRLPPLSPIEQKVWRSTERMNDRGVLADLPLVARIVDLVAQARPTIDQRIKELTGANSVNCRVALKRWFEAHGYDVPDTRKHTLADLLDEDIDDICREVLELIRDGGGTSHAKADVLLRRVSADGRLRGELIFCGAAQTGRWSSSGVQLQNIARHSKALNTTAIIKDLNAGATLDLIEQVHGPGLKVASELLRPTFVAPPRRRLIRLDFASIEARVIAWLAGDELTLDTFRKWDAGVGAEPYVLAARDIYHVQDPDEYQRTAGKVATLALGFAGAVGALRVMARSYGLKLSSDEAARIVAAWRAAHPVIVSFWHDMQVAAFDLVTAPVGNSCRVRRLMLRRERQGIVMKLPSRRNLVYWDPHIDFDEQDRPNIFHTRPQGAESKTYGGKCCQNATQGVARDLLAIALINLEAAGFNPVLTIHDEIVCETDRDPEEAKSIMVAVPAWADGLPIDASVSAGPRFSKG